MTKAVVIIPARFASRRLPGKPLLQDTGKTLLQHVVDQVRQATLVSRILVATDDDRISSACAGFGITAIRTSPSLPSGTDRCAAVAREVDEAVVVNVQGDEPEVKPAHIDKAIELASAEGVDIGTLAYPAPDAEHVADPNRVKVVFDHSGRALYFSRWPIPFQRVDGLNLENVTLNNRELPCSLAPQGRHFIHVGIYAFKRESLLAMAQLPKAELEEAEGLEQLRALVNGFYIRVGVVRSGTGGIDTEEDYRAFVDRWKRSQKN